MTRKANLALKFAPSDIAYHKDHYTESASTSVDPRKGPMRYYDAMVNDRSPQFLAPASVILEHSIKSYPNMGGRCFPAQGSRSSNSSRR